MRLRFMLFLSILYFFDLSASETYACVDSNPYTIFEVAASNPQALSLQKINNEAVGLELDVLQQNLDVLISNQPQEFEMSIPVGGGVEVILLLEKKNIFHNGSLTVNTSTGNTYQQNESNFYSGSLLSDPSKQATISIYQNQITGFFTTKGGKQLTIGKMEFTNENKHVIYAEENFDDSPTSACSDAPYATPVSKILAASDNITLSKSTGPNNVVKVYFEVDYDTYVELGSVQACVDMATGIFSGVHSIFQNIAVNLTMTEVYVWETPDSYDKTDNTWVQRLLDFRAFRPTFNGDVAHLLHRSTPNCYGGGIAYVGALCNGYGHGIEMMQCSSWQPYPTYNFPVALVAHELGHNLGGLHTHDCLWNGDDTAIDLCGGDLGCSGPNTVVSQNPGTIMSYCFFNTVDFTNPFHAQQIPIIQNYVYAATCLETDSDGDGVIDSNDICPGFDDTLDADGDGVPDGCDICIGHNDTYDPDGDGVPNGCDLCVGYDDTLDADGDGVPDGCDACEGFDDALDADVDGVADGCDVCPGFDDMIDTDIDGVPDGCDICVGHNDAYDPDGDGVPNGCDLCVGFDDALDADGDGVPDGCDVCEGFDDALDTDVDGVADGCDVCPGFDDMIDADIDGVPDGCDICVGHNDTLDADADGVPDGCDTCPGFDDMMDTDTDGVPDGCDVCEGFDDAVDADGDGVPDGCDVCPGFDDTIDIDIDDVPDGCDICDGHNDMLDTDGDSVPDGCDVCEGFDDAVDADGDGVPDGCDACVGFDDTLDMDGDTVPNACDCNPIDPMISVVDNCGTCGGSGSGTYGFSTNIPDILEHTGAGSNFITLNFPFPVTNVDFDILGIDALPSGNPSMQYTEQVTVEYVDQNSQVITEGVYINTFSANITISDTLQSITIYLEDVHDDATTNSVMEIEMTAVTACEAIIACPVACSSSSPLPTTPGTYVAEQTKVEGDWTYYCDCQGQLLLALDHTMAPTMYVDPSEVSIEVNEGSTFYTNQTGFITNPYGVGMMNCKWEVNPSVGPAIGEEVGVKFYYSDQVYNSLVDTLANRNTTVTVSAPTDLMFYKVVDTTIPDFVDIANLSITDVILFENGSSTLSTFAANMHPNNLDHYAEFKVTSFSGGGGGAGDETIGFLPVELISFTGVEENCEVQLQWETGSETNNRSFVIQKSYDGISFSDIGSIAGNNNGFTTNSYQFNDNKVGLTNLVYYRLKQIDIDGTVNFTKVVTVETDCQLATFNFYPNPVSEKVNLTLESDIVQTIEVNILTLDSKSLLNIPIDLDAGINTITLPMDAGFVPGLYIVQMKIGNRLISRKIVKGD